MEKKNDSQRSPADKTLGEHSLSLQAEGPMDTDSIELQREFFKGSNSKKSLEEEIWETVDNGLKAYPGDFCVVMLTKKERHLKNVVRNFLFHRFTCPRPEFDQTVYRYHRNDDSLEYLWTVPNNATCMNLPLYKNHLPEDQQLLISMAEAFNAGELDKYSDTVNLAIENTHKSKFNLVK